ncbi:hypothetical protein HWV62_25820 [Athelia sp. TMB]|nr:hypothetical protein HWV62_25820 [Athelia sp. TMB]
MRQNGNLKSNAFYNPNEARNPPPTNMIERERDSELEKYIRGKYEFRRFIARDISAKPAPEIPRSSTSQFASEGKALPARSASAAPQPTAAPPRADSLSYRPPTAAIPYKPPYKVPSTVQNRSVSQPLPSQQILAQTQPVAQPQPAPRPVAQPQQAPRPAPPAAPIKPPSDNPVWNDLLSLQGGQTASSSLPLQYQTPTQNSLQQQPFVGNAPSFGQQQSNPYAPQIGSLGMGMSVSSPFQQQSQQPFSSNPFGQVGQSSAFQSPAFTGMGAGQLGNVSAPSMPFQSSIPPFSQSAAAQQFQASLQSQPQGPSLFQPQPQQSYGQQQQAPYGQQQPSPFGQQPSPMSIGQQQPSPMPFGQQPSPMPMSQQQPSPMPFGQQPSPMPFGQQQPSPMPFGQQSNSNPFGQQPLPQMQQQSGMMMSSGNPFGQWQRQPQQNSFQSGYSGQQQW